MSDRCRTRLGRRELLVGAAGTFLLLRVGRAEAGPAKGPRWGYLIDLTRCIGCGACVRACKAENGVPESCFRTWVERYTFLRDGRVEVDSPDGAANGFPSDPPVEPGAIRKSFFVPKLCNQCEASPCVQVCPVGASYQTRDGVVLVDREHCVGCGYCVQACPYGSRFIDHAGGGWADKCTLCYHRITKGLPPACVQSCPVGARAFGDLSDPRSPLVRALETVRTGVLKPDLGTRPRVQYVGLDQEVV